MTRAERDERGAIAVQAQDSRPRPQAFEALRGTPLDPNGYSFSVSPDERWIAVLDAERERLDAAAKELPRKLDRRRIRRAVFRDVPGIRGPVTAGSAELRDHG